MSERTPRLSRRNFLLALGAGGTAAAAATIASQQSRSAAPARGESKRATKGYQESAHVRNYYRTAKV